MILDGFLNSERTKVFALILIVAVGTAVTAKTSSLIQQSALQKRWLIFLLNIKIRRILREHPSASERGWIFSFFSLYSVVSLYWSTIWEAHKKRRV